MTGAVFPSLPQSDLLLFVTEATSISRKAHQTKIVVAAICYAPLTKPDPLNKRIRFHMDKEAIQTNKKDLSLWMHRCECTSCSDLPTCRLNISKRI